MVATSPVSYMFGNHAGYGWFTDLHLKIMQQFSPV